MFSRTKRIEKKMILPLAITNLISTVFSRFTEPSTYIGLGGSVAVFQWASENQDFLEYLEQRPIVAVILILFAIGTMLKEKGKPND